MRYFADPMRQTALHVQSSAGGHATRLASTSRALSCLAHPAGRFGDLPVGGGFNRLMQLDF